MKNLKEIINIYLKNFIEESISNKELQSIGIERQTMKHLLQTIDKEIVNILNKNFDEIYEYSEKIGKILYKKFGFSLYFVIDALEDIQKEISYAIYNNLLHYDEENVELIFKNLIQGISKGYFKLKIEDKLEMIFIEKNSSEIDINILFRAYVKYLNSLLKNKSIINEESQKIHKWINSLEFKMLMHPNNLENENELLALINEMFNNAENCEIYMQNNDYKRAYEYLMILDEKFYMANDILKNSLINFIKNKKKYFFDFLSQTIILNKKFNYMLSIYSDLTNISITKEELENVLVQLFENIKEYTQHKNLKFTGIIDDSTAIHMVLQYEYKLEMENFFDFLKEKINELQNNNIIYLPQLIIRSIETKNLIGFEPYILEKLSFFLPKIYKDKIFYHFDEKSSKHIIDHTLHNIKLGKSVQNAINNKTIALYFQPIIHITPQKKELAFCEILVRLKEDCLIAAEEFIHYIIDANLTAELDILIYQKLRENIKEIAKIVNKVSINIFPSSFDDMEVIKELKLTLNECKKHNIFVVLEILEYNIFNNYAVLQDLKNEFPDTLKIALDDFGKGYSSFSSIVNLKNKNLINEIKIDGSLTKELTKDETYFEIVKIAVSMIKTLQLTPVIEYIENKEIEEKILTVTDEFYGQGYYYSKPLPLEKFKEFKLKQ